MVRRNAENLRIKHRYFEYLEHAESKSGATVRQFERAILRYEENTGFEGFKCFDQKKAMRFKEALSRADLAPATILSTLTCLKRFFGWLALQPGYKRQIKFSEIEFLNLPEKDIRAASAPADKGYPSLQMVKQVISLMPSSTAIEKRDRALVAFIAVTGIRDGALVTLKLKHFDRRRSLVLQNPKEVQTKFGKRIDTFLFPLDDELERIFLDWVDYLSNDLLFADNDPLFPKTALGQDHNKCFSVVGLGREHWANASPVRTIFKAAFERADLEAFGPHRFRDMIVSEMYRRDLSIAEFKAWSQNLGHEGAMTTLTSYGKLSLEEQGKLVRTGSGIPRQSRHSKSKNDMLQDIGL